jgi:hypothetical protein
MIIGHLEITHSVECRECGKDVRGGTQRRMYARFAFHLWARHRVITLKQMLAVWRSMLRGGR